MQQIEIYQRLFQQYLSSHPFKSEPASLYEPINYIMELGGKRLRPVLALLGYSMFEERPEKALPVAYAVELFHNFTLVHDDFMDQAPLRRGKPTVHELYGANTGILSGDVMLIHVYDYLLQACDPAHTHALISAFNRIAVEVCQGQQYDIEFESRQEVAIEEYIRMIELKTAALLGGSLELGAIVAGAPPVDIQRLAFFGRQIGIAFQLHDDLLDVFGDPGKFGKKVGGDIVQNKKTFLVLKALELADEATRQRLRSLLADSKLPEPEKISAVTALFEQLDIARHTEIAKSTFRQQAYESLEAVQAPDAKKQVLIQLAEQLMEREV
jgi:geranylgeranyl diphosphate synthase type II